MLNFFLFVHKSIDVSYLKLILKNKADRVAVGRPVFWQFLVGSDKDLVRNERFLKHGASKTRTLLVVSENSKICKDSRTLFQLLCI